MTLIRSLAYLLWLYGTIVLVGAAFAPFALFSPRAAILAIRTEAAIALWGLRWICGARVVVEGIEHLPKGAGLIASKHQAMLDTIVPFRLLDAPAFILKRELLLLPIFGWYMGRARMIAIRREAQARALREMLQAARAAIAAGRPIVIFPEGTRQAPGAAPDYKPGVAALYRDLGLPCTPIALNTGHVWPAHGILRKPGVATLRILEPIPAGLGRDEFMGELERRIETATAELSPAQARRDAA